MRTLATDLGQLSDDVKLFMELLTSDRYYALNDRTINLLMKGDIDMSVVIGEEEAAISISDAGIMTIIDEEPEVEIFVVDEDKTKGGGALFPYLNNTIFELTSTEILQQLTENNYKHNCLYLALEAGGLY